MLHRPWILPSAITMVFLFACGDNAEGRDNAEGKGNTSNANAIPESCWSEAALAKPTRVRDVRRDAKDGAEMVVTGRVKDFVPGRAVFTLIDSELKSCAENEGDTCTTPWDYCCEEADVVAKNTITVEIHDSAGRPLRTGFQGFHGLDNLQTVVLRGKIRRDKQGNVTAVLGKLARVR
jgi:hypothetical protein